FLFFCVATAIAALPFDTVFKGRAKFDQLIERAEKENWSALPIGERVRSEEHTSELQSPYDLVCRLLLEKKKQIHCTGPPWPSQPLNRSAQSCYLASSCHILSDFSGNCLLWSLAHFLSTELSARICHDHR